MADGELLSRLGFHPHADAHRTVGGPRAEAKLQTDLRGTTTSDLVAAPSGRECMLLPEGKQHTFIGTGMELLIR